MENILNIMIIGLKKKENIDNQMLLKKINMMNMIMIMQKK